MPTVGSSNAWPGQNDAADLAWPTLGLRILLLVLFAVVGMISGLFSFFELLGISNGATSPSDITFAAVVLFLCGASLLAFCGIAIRASWARPIAIVAGIAISLTCVGMVVGIPILIAASRANLSRRPADTPEPI